MSEASRFSEFIWYGRAHLPPQLMYTRGTETAHALWTKEII